MLIRIDRRHPGMVPLEMQTIRCNDPMQVLPWRHRRGRSIRRRRSARPADDALLEWGRLTIRRAEKRRALFLHPCWHTRRQIVVGSAGRCCGESGRSSAAREHDTASEQLTARDACLLGLPFGHRDPIARTVLPNIDANYGDRILCPAFDHGPVLHAPGRSIAPLAD